MTVNCKSCLNSKNPSQRSNATYIRSSLSDHRCFFQYASCNHASCQFLSYGHPSDNINFSSSPEHSGHLTAIPKRFHLSRHCYCTRKLISKATAWEAVSNLFSQKMYSPNITRCHPRGVQDFLEVFSLV